MKRDQMERHRAEHLKVLAAGKCTLKRSASDIKHTFFYFWFSFLIHWKILLIIALLTIGISLFVVRPVEGDFNSWLKQAFDPNHWDSASQWVSWTGEYLFHLVVFIPLLAIGRILRSRRIQVLAICVLLSIVTSSLTVRAGKFSFGRLRPVVAERLDKPDTFIGPTINPKYHSYPSGHTAAAFATSTPVQVCAPLLAIPLTLYAGTVALSRTYNNQHYVSDLIAGLVIGVLVSMPSRRLWNEIGKAEN